MANRYKEVLMTYLRRPFSSWYAGLKLIVVAFLTMFGLSGRGVSAGSLTLGMLFLSTAIWLHIREQMTDARRRLMPTFVRPHIVGFLAWSICFVGFFSLLSLYCVRLAVPEMTGLLLLIFGYVGCCVVTRIRYLFLLGLVGLFCLLVLITGEPPFAAVPMKDPRTGMVLAVIGLAASAWAIVRLTRASEEDLGQHRTIRMRWLERSRHGAPKTEILVASKPIAPASYKANSSANDRARALRHGWRRSGMFSSRKLWFSFSLIFPIWMFLSLGHHPSRLNVIVGAQFALPALLFFPAMLAGMRWLTMGPYVSAESLRPASRALFTKELGITLFLYNLKAFGIASTLFLAAVYTIGGGLVGSLVVVPFLLAVALAQPLVFAVYWWVMSYRNAFLLVLPATVLMGIATAFFPTGNYEQLIAIGAVLMVLGLILMPFVYHRWMNLEMGS